MERIGILGDVHYLCSPQSFKRPSSVKLRPYYEAVLEYLTEKMQTATFLSVGDIAHNGRKSEFSEFYSLVKARHMKLSHVMGNHDLLIHGKDELAGLEFYRRDCLVRGESCYILYLDTAKERREDDWGGILTGRQLDLLERSVTESGKRPLVVAAHHPVYGTTYGSTDYLMSIEANERIGSILERKEGQGIFVNGHTHLSSMARRGSWTFVQAASIMNMNAVPFIETDGESAQVVWIPVNDQALKETGYKIGSNLYGYTYLSDEYLEKGGERVTWV